MRQSQHTAEIHKEIIEQKANQFDGDNICRKLINFIK